MKRIWGLMTLALATAFGVQADETKTAPAGDWVTVKGKIVWDEAKGAPPKRTPIKATKDEEVAAKDKEFLTEDWVVNTKNGGIKNVVVWLAPEPTAAQLADLKSKKLKVFPSFDPKDVNPAMAKPVKPTVEIDQPCCRFIPHIVVAQEGQKLVIKNSSIIPHNAKYVGNENGEGNPLIPAGGAFTLPNPLVKEKFPVELSCSIHPWMKAYIRVFDHPYFAVTDADGNFEIKNAPVLKGKLRMFVWQDNGYSGGAAGAQGSTFDVKPGTLDRGAIKFDVPQ
ncbi:cupredoxin domain-containing protein [Zavarzinella formosa]|uniref:hypothetical protein n=1 Tax=Zavarzinella formosa TaxID=360055 RepID=UPI0002DCBE6B|nr:hypothetical protein [Zavarzinella formosa]